MGKKNYCFKDSVLLAELSQQTTKEAIRYFLKGKISKKDDERFLSKDEIWRFNLAMEYFGLSEQIHLRVIFDEINPNGKHIYMVGVSHKEQFEKHPEWYYQE